jgi:anaerobic ribonucleoside-triphosphate reductase
MEKKSLKVPTEIYTRCVGFFRPVSHFNKGKKEEFKERVYYKVPNNILDK